MKKIPKELNPLYLIGRDSLALEYDSIEDENDIRDFYRRLKMEADKNDDMHLYNCILLMWDYSYNYKK